MTADTAKKKEHEKNTVFEDFDNLTLKAIDEALSPLGEKSKTVIYSYLERKYHINKKEIPNQIESFSKALEELLKTSAAQLEILCMENLFVQVKKTRRGFICGTITNVTLKQYVQFMKQQYIEEKK